MPYTGNYKIELWGAQGNKPSSLTTSTAYGAYVSGNIKINSNDILYVYIGQFTNSHSSTSFNAGSLGGNYLNTTTTCPTRSCKGYGGGGATDIRTISGTWNNTTSLRSRIIVAGGGGGDMGYHNYASTGDISYSGVYDGGGAGGGLTSYGGGWWSNNNPARTFSGPGGSNQTSGGTQSIGHDTNYGANGGVGTFGVGGSVAQSGISYEGSYGGGGGGGWYGGTAGGVRPSQIASGAGGSSYISGHTGSVAVTSTSSSSPKSGCTTGTTSNACSITPYINPATNAGYTFTNTVMIDGAGYKWTNTKGSLQAMPNPSGGNYTSGVGHSGNGYARITYLGT